MRNPGNEVAITLQPVLLFELTIIVNCQVPLNLPLSLILEHQQFERNSGKSHFCCKKTTVSIWTGLEPTNVRFPILSSNH